MSEPNSETVRAVVVDPEAPTHLGFGEAPLRSPSAQDVVVEVACFSLNRGELRFAAGKPKGAPIGWDVAGVVERGGGLPAGTRVVGFVRAQDGWAEKVVLPASDVAPLPDGVDFPTAAALPVAGGTALAVVDAAGPGLLGARALVTGVTG
ncbi:MAG: hypothetical protein KC731_14970, partial [Myxococcales bacterium]|nr:hypothetical protein [Myxococcales bacterium]